MSTPSSAGAWVRAVRPTQWIKNALVLAAPGAAGVLDQSDALLDTAGAVAAFCLVASGTYLLNDARDVESDRRHPTKRERPIAAGQIQRSHAVVVGVLLLASGVAAGAAITAGLAMTLLAYVGITAAYSWGLRDVAVVDVLAIASGFVLRAVAGAAAVDVPISTWFFIVTSAGALFMAVGKRSGEVHELGATEGAAVRKTLLAYTPSYLAYLRSVSSGVVLVAYCLWAFETAELSTGRAVWYEITILPFTAAIFRYALLIDQGAGSAPEQLVLTDRVLQIIALAWLAAYGVAVYGA
jgi:decaprenyl-phosphate phosphoribosyltransferase